MRVTEGLMMRNFLAHSSNALARSARLQEMIASGRKFLKPSDDPAAVAKVMGLRSDIRAVDAYRDNASSATMIMSMTESALSEVSNVLSRAKELLVSAINDSTGEGGRDSIALELSQMVATMLLVANREVGGRSLFGGSSTLSRPYEQASEGVLYRGDAGELVEEIGAGLRVVTNLTGPQAFQTIPSRIEGSADLDPAASTITPLADLMSGLGVSTGHIRITDSDDNSAEIDLLSANDVGDVIDGINDAGLAVTASLSADGESLVLTDTGGGTSFRVEDLFGGSMARDLGILGTSTGSTLEGADLDPALTENTPTALLFQGSGIGAGTWTLRNSGERVERSATIDPTRANTVGDLLGLIENATTESGGSLGIRATLDKSGLVLESAILHTRISVADDGGASARALGVAATEEARDVFALLEAAAEAVRSGDEEEMDRMLRDIDSAVNRTAGVRGTYGVRARQVLALAENLETRKLDLTIRLSDVEDVNLAEAAMELARADTTYNAALATGSRIFELSLFNFIR